MVDSLLTKVNNVILVPIVSLLFAVAFLVFVWGVFEYLIRQNDPDARATGGQHILWGVIGMTIMVSAWGIINFIIKSLESVR